MHQRIFFLASTLIALGMHAAMIEPAIETWANSVRGFEECEKQIRQCRGRNILSRDGVKVVDKGNLSAAHIRMLTDGTAGVRLGDGRAAIGGKPSVLTFYLGGIKPITRIGLFTYNSDARANQDYEVRLVDNGENPGKKPSFENAFTLSTGNKILGPDRGGCHTYFGNSDGTAMCQADWVQFRIWQTYNQKAGSPAKSANSATSWSAVVELEAWGDEGDVIVYPEDDIRIAQSRLIAAMDSFYRKTDSWQETLRTTAERARSANAQDQNQNTGVCSPVLRGGDEAIEMELDVTGLRRVWLETGIGGDNFNADQAIWGEPVLIDANGTRTPLSSFKPSLAKVGWGELKVDQDHWGTPLKVGERTFKHGFWAHAPSRLAFELDGKYVRFVSWIGIGWQAGKGGSATFRAASLPTVSDEGTAGFTKVLWQRLGKDFPDSGFMQEMAWEKADGIWETPWSAGAFWTLAKRYAEKAPGILGERAAALAVSAQSAADLQDVREVYYRAKRYEEVSQRLAGIPWDAMVLAVNDLSHTFPEQYVNGPQFVDRITALRAQCENLQRQIQEQEGEHIQELDTLITSALAMQREALLANPLLDLDTLLLVRRKTSASALGLPANWQSNSTLRRTGYSNDIAVLSPVTGHAELLTVYRPGDDTFVGDLELHPSADRLMFSKSDPTHPWQVYELDLQTHLVRQVTPDMGEDINNYDSCYLPNGDVLFTSTATMVAVPCVNGSSPVANLFRMSRDGSQVRQLCFDQEHNWCPTLLNNGRVLYLRWEYTDLPHSNSRILFQMNPDGTGQMEFYGSNSYWPNSVFYARPIPGNSGQVVGIVSGHHGVRRMGELVIFDPARGRQEAEGVVQRIPGYGKPVNATVADRLVDGAWPKFLHPYPLGRDDGKGAGKYFLVSAKTNPSANWGIYLVDIFDNMVLLKEEPGYALLEPIPLTTSTFPPMIPDRVDLSRKDGLVYMVDVTRGPGLAGVPKDAVKQLRIYSYTYGYRNMGGLYGTVGMDGPWDVRRVLGTVPVYEDGSALFRVPANVPLAVQPLDAEGKALQIMRSWFTVMPGETLSCVGCHEKLNGSPPAISSQAIKLPATGISPTPCSKQGFSFAREVQPVLDAHCIRCHNGVTERNGKRVFSLRGDEMLKGWTSKMSGRQSNRFGGLFSVAYANLHRYVRRPGIESEMHIRPPMDYHADTTQLIQLLKKGHFGVSLSRDEFGALVTWIDMNAPFHGDWGTIAGDAAIDRETRRAECRKLYANVDEFHIYESLTAARKNIEFLQSIPREKVDTSTPNIKDWPFDGAEAAKRQNERPAERVQLPDGVSMDFVYIPPGEFLMGSCCGHRDEQPVHPVRIEHGFWMSRTELTNAQYAVFDSSHDSERESKQGYQFGVRGYPLNRKEQPVVRVSWLAASEYCRWLSGKLGQPVALPTEAQWEYACRAGTDTAFSFGDADSDYSQWANMADETLAQLASNPYTETDPIRNPPIFDDWAPHDDRFNDGTLVSGSVAKYAASPWGLCDMHGNVWEWTRSAYRPYPYSENDGRNELRDTGEERVVRGGSWRDRPSQCTSSFRLSYRPYQGVYNVGFRVIVDADLLTLGGIQLSQAR